MKNNFQKLIVTSSFILAAAFAQQAYSETAQEESVKADTTIKTEQQQKSDKPVTSEDPSKKTEEAIELTKVTEEKKSQ